MNLAMFDIDGTLTQSDVVDEECFLRALKDVFGFREINNDWSAYPHCTDGALLATIFQERLGRAPASDEIAEFQAHFITLLAAAANQSPFQPVAGAREMLSHLLAAPEWAVSLASGAWEASARLKLASAELHFPNMPGAFADDAPAREAIMRASLDKALRLHGGTSFDSVVYIGDGVWDARACRDLGWPFIGIASDAAKIARLRSEGARHVFPHFLKAQAFLDALQS